MDFGIDFFALWFFFPSIVAIILLRRWRSSYPSPTLYYSHLQDLIPTKPSLRSKLASLPRTLSLLALVGLLVAFIDPHFNMQKTVTTQQEMLQHPSPKEGIAIYLVLDHSGSMRENVIISTPSGRRQRFSKLNLAKEVTGNFINSRPDDLIGLITFARSSQVLSPLTLEHSNVTKQLDEITFVEEREQEGTAIGYAIFKTVNLIAATRHYAQELQEEGLSAYTIKNSIMILITDGFQDPHPEDKGRRLRTIDLLEAAEYAKQNHVKLYLINVEPRIGSEQFAPHRRLMQRVTELTGGKFYLVDSTHPLDQVYADIERIEKSVLPADETSPLVRTHRISLYPYLIALSMCLLFASVFLDTTLLRRAP